MSTMLSDKAEQLGAGSAPAASPVGGGVGSVGTMTVEVTEIPVGGGDDANCGCAGVAGNTRQVLSSVVPAVKTDAQDLKFQAEDYVIEHPLKAVGIAAGVGFVLGVVWSAGGRRTCRC